ncbi:MAG: aspartate--ammonia ligase [Limnochordia bacterium]|jgi:aspartate--ammonia ligase
MQLEYCQLILPERYDPKLSLEETQIAIKQIKDFFERTLATQLNLTRVTAPLFVVPESGLNDNLTGRERPVSFDVPALGTSCEIVHSLAKWKRMALKRYAFSEGRGLYTDMNAIRRDEELDNLHSIYVDQWDWEKVISRADRTPEYLCGVVEDIYQCLLVTAAYITELYPTLDLDLPESITFMSTQELEDRYPHLTPHAREDAAAREYGAVFLMQIGHTLRSGQRHDGRAPDYDDWNLNGDILVWHPVLERVLELSSMGIRVDAQALLSQLEIAGCLERLEFEYHRELVHGNLPYTIGGGIGQSRLCMFLLQRAHIGEVQASVWPAGMAEVCRRHNIILL